MTTPQLTKEDLELQVKRLEKEAVLLSHENETLRQKQQRSEKEIQLLQSVLDSIPDVVGVQLPDHTVLRYNRAGYEFVDLEPDQLENKKCFELIGRTRPCAPCATSDALASKSMAEHERYFPEIGKYLNCRATPVLNQEGEITHVVEMLQDITQRKLTEEAHQEGEARYRALVESSFDHIFMLSPDGTYLASNNRIEQFGIDKGKSLLGCQLEDVYPPEVAEFYRKQIQMVMTSYQAVDFEHSMIEAQGVRYHLDTLYPIYKEKQLSAIGGICRDITEQKAIEQKLKEKEKKYRRVVETALDGFWVVNTTGWIEEVNQSYADMSGYSVDELVGMHISQLEAVEDENGVEEHVLRIMKNGFDRFESRHRRKDGSVFDIEVSTAFDLESKAFFTAFVRDITDRLQTEQVLRESEAHYRSVVRAAPIGIGVVADRVISQVNERLCQIVGFSRQELLGKNARVLYPTFEDYAYVGREKYRQIFDNGTGVVETRFQRKDGHIIDVLLSSSPLDEHDFSQGVTFTALDITKRKQAEIALAESKREFESIFENSQVGIGLLRGGRVLHRGNQRLADILGFHSPKEMAGINMRQLHLDQEHYEDFGRHFYTTLTK